MRKFTIVLMLLMTGLISMAQKISGVVKDQNGKGLDKTTVSLLKAADSSVFKLSVTDKDGNYSFQTEPGKYLVSLSHIGYTPQYGPVIEVAGTDVTLPGLTMAKLIRTWQV